MFDYTKNNAMTNCHICGQPVERKGNSLTVGKCPLHSQMWREDIEYGLHKRNRLRDIMVERGEVSECDLKSTQQQNSN